MIKYFDGIVKYYESFCQLLNPKTVSKVFHMYPSSLSYKKLYAFCALPLGIRKGLLGWNNKKKASNMARP